MGGLFSRPDTSSPQPWLDALQSSPRVACAFWEDDFCVEQPHWSCMHKQPHLRGMHACRQHAWTYTAAHTYATWMHIYAPMHACMHAFITALGPNDRFTQILRTHAWQVRGGSHAYRISHAPARARGGGSVPKKNTDRQILACTHVYTHVHTRFRTPRHVCRRHCGYCRQCFSDSGQHCSRYSQHFSH